MIAIWMWIQFYTSMKNRVGKNLLTINKLQKTVTPKLLKDRRTKLY
jgi:hypothetical protein